MKEGQKERSQEVRPMHNNPLSLFQLWHFSISEEMKNWGANHGKWQNWKENAVENGRDAQHVYNGAITQDKKRQSFNILQR